MTKDRAEGYASPASRRIIDGSDHAEGTRDMTASKRSSSTNDVVRKSEALISAGTLTRRAMMVLAAGALTARRAAAAEPPAIKVGTLQFGTVGWEIDTIRRFGLDAAAGLRIEAVKLASNDAARIGFLGGGVDTIVTDLLWAARMRGEGRDIVFLPFSASEGALMAPAASSVRVPADLAGRRLGVAGGPLDKSWLLLQAVARRNSGLDLAHAATPAFGAPPLLAQKLEAGELDAALLFWNFCARLEAKGYRRVLGVDDMARALGATGPISFLGYVFDRGRLGDRSAALPAFASASREAKARLAGAGDAWVPLRPLMQVDDDNAFAAMKKGFIEGIPRRPLDEEQADAERLYGLLADLGGETLVGATKRLPAGLYWTGG